MSPLPAHSGRISPKLSGIRGPEETWIVAGLGDGGRVDAIVADPDMMFIRAFDGKEVRLTGHVVVTSSAAKHSLLGGRVERAARIADRRALREQPAGWRALGAFTAQSPDGLFVAELMELLAINRGTAPGWLMSAVKAAREVLDSDAAVDRFYEALLLRGVATTPAAGQWGTCDFEEWRYRLSAKAIDAYAAKLFAIRCLPSRSATAREAIVPSDVVGMCETVAPAAYYVCVRNSHVSRVGGKVGVDLEVEAGHVSPAGWMDTSPVSAKFEIAAPIGARERATLVVPAGERSGVQKLHFDVQAEEKTVNVTVFDERKRRYDLPIDLA